MKVTSCGAEIRAKLSEIEVKGLENLRLACDLEFHGTRSDEKYRKIPGTMEIRAFQKEPIRVEISPHESYIGSASFVAFCFSKEYYNRLSSEGYAVDRFGLGGKLEMFNVDVNDGRVGQR